MTEKIVVLDMMAPARAEKLRALLPPGMILTHGLAEGDEHMKEIIADADYAIAGQVAVSGDVLRAGKKLKLLHKWGVGVDNLDLDAARQIGVRVARTTGSNAIPVAEFALGLALAALRAIAFGNAELKQGRWRGLGGLPMSTYTLTGKTFGIIGFFCPRPRGARGQPQRSRPRARTARCKEGGAGRLPVAARGG